ncbi:MAG: hypothetical protein ACQESR_27005 [Planctomycetota bacterium]
MESCPTQAVLPLVGLAAEKTIHDRYNGLGWIVNRTEPAYVRGRGGCSQAGTNRWGAACDPHVSLSGLILVSARRRRGPRRPRPLSETGSIGMEQRASHAIQPHFRHG